MADERDGLGAFSLQAMAAGAALPLAMVVLFAAFLEDGGVARPRLVGYLLAALFGFLELLALVTGLAGWSSRAGKLGAILALVLLVGASAAIGWRRLGKGDGPAPGGQPAANVQDEPPPTGPAKEAPAPPDAPPPQPSGSGELFPNVPAR
jgi:hypothetical protein